MNAITYYKLLQYAYQNDKITSYQVKQMKTQAKKQDFIEKMQIVKYDINHGKGQTTVLLINKQEAVSKLCEYLMA